MTTTSAGGGTDLQARAKQMASRAGAAVKAMSPATRITAAVAVLVVGVGGFLFIRWAAAPTYAPLFSNLAGPDASAVIDKLNASGVPYQLGGDGSEILVPQDQVYSQRIALSADGLPSSPDSGYSLLDDEGVTTSEFRQRLDYQRALEGELDNTIGAIDGVQQATVHLAMPAQDVFDDGTQKTTASVLLVLDRGGSLSAQQVTAVVNLVASSVPGLSTDDVTVTDASGRVLSAGGEAAGAGAADQAVSGYEQRMTQNLQALLDNLVGPGHALVSVTAQLDPSKSSTTSRTYTGSPDTPPIAQSTTSETYSGNGASATGGVAGVVATPAATDTTASGSGNGSYTKTTNTQNNSVGTVDSTVETPPGQVQRLSVAVVIDSAVASSVSTAAVTDLVTSAAGVDTNRGDSLSVQQMAIDHSTAEQAQAAADDAAKADEAAASRAMLVKLGSFGLLGLIVLVVVIGLLARRRHRREPPGDDRYELLISPDDQDPSPPEPEPLVPDRPWSEQNLDTTRKELHNLAVDKPGDVARVLRSWLSD